MRNHRRLLIINKIRLLQLQMARRNFEIQTTRFTKSIAEGMSVFIRSASGEISFCSDKPGAVLHTCKARM